ncbi:cupin domain-containing protein [Ochrobactrum sp. C6C9]|uniref:cupin domain-containing protein n=1 Tax=Ochrobactrum sp. C6C9 TaxID=2736662 RepID=UPI0035301175
MSRLVTLNTKELPEGIAGTVALEKLLEGNPRTMSWEQDRIDGKVRSGVWEMTPGMNRSIKGHVYEYCHILEGEVEITPDGGEAQRYRAGDHFIMKPGFVGTWRTIKTVRKVYVIVG